ncbi:MAG TPA: ATP-binding protein [Micromonosporaceae bacterium]
MAVLYGGVFFATGAVLLGFVDAAFWQGGSSQTVPANHPAQTVSAAGRQHGDDLRLLLIASAVGLIVAGVLAAVLGWAIAGRALRPLRTMTATAQAISADSLHSRIGLDSPYEEFAELGSTLDDLFARLDAAFRSQRDFVANASHELRTPLTAERALLQVALADPDVSVQTLRAACDEVLALGAAQEHLIDSLLTLASSEQAIERWEPLDLAAITAEVTLSRQDDAARRGIQLTTALTDATASGDPRLVESLVANLVDNAIRHNIPGGRVDVATSGTAVTVHNTGPTIPPAEVDRLFEPFQRLRRERVRPAEGHGLGLTIVRAIAAAHGAAITTRALDSGGLVVEVTFPTHRQAGNASRGRSSPPRR